MASLIIPLGLMLIGAKLLFLPQAERFLYYYQTKMSSINQETSDFAQKYFGKMSIIVGGILLIPSVILAILMQGEYEGIIRTLFMVLIVVQIAGVVLSATLTENALKKNFDESGNKK